MKISDYVRSHQGEGKKIDCEKTVSATSLVNEIVCFKDIARIDKTKFGKAAYIVQIDDDTAFWTSSNMTRTIDKMVEAGVELESFKGCRFLVVRNHVDEWTDKQGVVHPACDPIDIEFVEEAE